jgi:hypothetical protein
MRMAPKPRRLTVRSPSWTVLDEVAGYGFEAVGADAVGLEGGEGFFDELGGVALALLDAVDGGPGGFFRGQVLAGGLAQLRRVHGHVEHIVHDLEGQAGFAAEAVEAGQHRPAVAPA